jgi:DNA mismatch repair protein PMS2
MSEIDQPWNCPHGRPTMRHVFNLRLLRDMHQPKAEAAAL